MNLESDITAYGLRLRSLEKGDLPLLAQWRNDPSILPYMHDSRPVNPAILTVWFNKFKNSQRDYPCVACWNNKPVAYAELTAIDKNKSECEGGLFLFGKEYFGKGLAYRILLCREILMKDLGIRTLISLVKNNNPRGIRFCQNYGGILAENRGDFSLYRHEFAPRRRKLREIADSLNLGAEYRQNFGE